MKKVFKQILVILISITMLLTATTTVVFASTGNSEPNPTVVQTQEDISRNSFFQPIVDFFRNIFYSRISFDTDGGSKIEDFYRLKFTKVPTPQSPTKEGYTFSGWDPEVPSRMPWRSMTVKAKWQTNEHTVYWVIDGVTVKTEKYFYGDKINAYIPAAKEGHTLSEWKTIPESMPDSDVTIVANYVANGYRVTWDVDGVRTTDVISYGDKTRVPADPEKKGYSFAGWEPAVSKIVTKNVVYTAKWEKITEIINAKDDEEFSNEVMQLVDKSLNDINFNKEKALEDEFYMSRVIANCNDLSAIDFSEFEADTIIINNDGSVVLQFANRDLAERCSRYLNAISSVSFAEADIYLDSPDNVAIEEIPEMSSSIWSEKYINADKYAYYLENNGKNDMITVAVIDTGIDMDHPYFNGRLAAGRNCFNGSANVEDDKGHGTHVAGIIVNCTNNLNVKIIPVRSLTATGGSMASVVQGIKYAVSQGADVINLSLEGPYSSASSYLERAINDAIDKGTVVVVSAGNGAGADHAPVNTAYVSPANMDRAIVVGALDKTGTAAFFSNFGASVDVIAPGIDIPSTYPNGKYALMSGTSQAAPHIAAVAAMFRLEHPTYTPAQIETLIKEYCVDKGPAGRDDFYGEGCPDMYDAIPNCTISFNSNGGSYVSSATTKNSSTVILPTPSRSYKVSFNGNGGTVSGSSRTVYDDFEGWYAESSLNGQKLNGGESYMLLKDQTLYAKWSNGTLQYTPRVSRSGYQFVGWYDSPNGGTRYSTSSSITKDITLYAQWRQYSISFNANGGYGAPSTIYGYGTTSLPSSKPSRDGYMFLGWSENSWASSSSYSAGRNVTLTNNMTLYAVWGKRSVTLSNYGGSSNQLASVSAVVDGTPSYWIADLPTVTYANVSDLSGETGWVIESSAGEAMVSGSKLYMSQPGTYKLRYYKNGYASDVYTYTLSLYKTTSALNYIRSNPTDESSSRRVGSIPANTTVVIHEVCHTGTYTPKSNYGKAAWGKVTYNGVTGWIILFA